MIRIRETGTGRFLYYVYASNGQPIAVSLTSYNSKGAALRGAESLVRSLNGTATIEK